LRGIRAIVVEILQFDQLLRDRAAAFDDLSGHLVCIGRPQNSEQIDAGMTVETTVLNAQHGVYQNRWKFPQRRLRAAQRPNSSEWLPVCRFEQESGPVRFARWPVDRQAKEHPQARRGDEDHATEAGKG
jgi:hypothetical protein